MKNCLIDYAIVCIDIKRHVEEMFIDEERLYALTRHTKNKKTLTDHNLLFVRFSGIYNQKLKVIRKECFNLKENKGQIAFLEETSNLNILSASFSPNQTLRHNANIFFKRLKTSIFKCFKRSESQKVVNAERLRMIMQ